ncbi:glutamate racemase [Candidatus Peregrinibacteria bacterium HGW-Peregrinibacteria-1]|jgi:glutamate racemase|nr:MAG: glutamate racemase [Candidatus Peregrinibacteria bacterium HGW-Peregrinibacteria-1]
MIGIFDSGYGGLTVLKDIIQLLPNCSYLYLGDNARAPYGPQSVESITRHTLQGTRFLVENGAKTIVIACNTVASVAMDELRIQFPEITFIDVITPTVNEALRLSKKQHIAVIGTSTTIESESYPHIIQKTAPTAKVFTKACPLLVPFIEENWHHKPEAISITKKYLRYIKSTNSDVLILGCTHYPFMKKDIKRIMGRKTAVLTSGEPTAQELQAKIDAKEITHLKTGDIRIFTTGNPVKFNKFSNQHFPELPPAQKCTIN